MLPETERTYSRICAYSIVVLLIAGTGLRSLLADFYEYVDYGWPAPGASRIAALAGGFLIIASSALSIAGCYILLDRRVRSSWPMNLYMALALLYLRLDGKEYFVLPVSWSAWRQVGSVGIGFNLVWIMLFVWYRTLGQGLRTAWGPGKTSFGNSDDSGR